MRKNCSSWSFQICGTLSMLIAFMSCSSIGCCFEDCFAMAGIAPAQWPGCARFCDRVVVHGQGGTRGCAAAVAPLSRRLTPPERERQGGDSEAAHPRSVRADDIDTVIELPMPDVTCRHMVRLVTARLRDVPGVVTVHMDAATGAVVVTGQMSRAAAAEAVAEAVAEVQRRVRHLPDCRDSS